MAETFDASSDRAAERLLHQRLLAGDPVAPADFAERYLTALSGWLRRRFPTFDPHLLESAAADALFRLAREPGRYDPGRGGLFAYLRMDARGDVLNAHQAEQRRVQRVVALESVELRPEWRNLRQEERFDRAEEDDAAFLEQLHRQVDSADQAALGLWLEGERRSEPFAAALGLTGLTLDEQRREVKRWKDRMGKRLRRWMARRP
jgi:hypothetical protein